jgi:enoyl-CoA hydratase / long-chain 3-hydroxyacyl-CoA dehydrogenase
VRDGVPLETLDKAVKNFGMPVGPVTLADEVGVDVVSHVAKFLSKADLGTRMSGGDVTLMEKMIEKGWLGKKSGQGFYTYDGKKKSINSDVKKYIKDFVQQDLKLQEKEIQDRIISRFVNEAAKCLEDEIRKSCRGRYWSRIWNWFCALPRWSLPILGSSRSQQLRRHDEWICRQIRGTI